MHSHLNLQKESFQKEFEGALAKISFSEEQLHDFEQKHGYLQEELLLTKTETKTYKIKYASKCEREIYKMRIYHIAKEKFTR